MVSLLREHVATAVAAEVDETKASCGGRAEAPKGTCPGTAAG